MTFNPRKSAQVVAFFVTKSRGASINVLKAIKLVYLADRRSIQKFGFPILDEPRVSMPHGPVNSTTYSYVNGEIESEGWSEFLDARAHHQIGISRAVTNDDLDELSDADLQCLEETWREFGHMDQWQLVDYTHDRRNVPEWEDPKGSSRPIPLERILTMVGIENGDENAAVVEGHRQIDSVFKSLS